MSVKNKTNDLCGQSILFKKNGLVGSSVIVTGIISMRVQLFHFSGNNGVASTTVAKCLPLNQ